MSLEDVKKSSLIGLNQINTQNVHTLYIKNMSLALRKKALHQNFKVMSLQYVKKSNHYLSQPLKYRQDYRHT